MPEVVPQGSLQEVVSILSFDINYIFDSLSDSIGKQITKECSKIFPLENVLIRKVKVLKKPKFDLTKLMELYQDKPEVAAKPEADDAKNALAE